MRSLGGGTALSPVLSGAASPQGAKRFKVSSVALSERGEFTSHEGISRDNRTAPVTLPAGLGAAWCSPAPSAAGDGGVCPLAPFLQL